jgi:hypothetical protein
MGRDDYLFPETTFVEGLGSAIDLFGALARYNSSRGEREADLRALRSDWGAVAEYLWLATAAEAAALKKSRRLAVSSDRE